MYCETRGQLPSGYQHQLVGRLPNFVYLENFRKEFSIDLVVGFYEDFPQTALSHWIVFGIELVEPVHNQDWPFETTWYYLDQKKRRIA